MSYDPRNSQQPPAGGWQQPPQGYYPPQGQPPPPQGWQPPQYPPQYGQPQPPYYPPQPGQWQQPPYGQPPQFYPGPMPPPKKKGGAGKVIGFTLLGIIGFFILIGVIGAAAGGGKTTATATPGFIANSAAVLPTGAMPASSVAPTLVPMKPNATMVPGLNQTVSVKNWDMTVTGVEQPGKSLQLSSYGKPTDAVGTWVVVQVKMKNTGKENFGVNGFDYQLRTPNGVMYKTSDKLEAYSYSEYRGGANVSGQVPPSVEVTFYLVFDVAPNTTGLQLQFNQDKKPVVNLGI